MIHYIFTKWTHIAGMDMFFLVKNGRQWRYIRKKD